MPSAIATARRNRRAVIIGGSISGLFAAAFLRQQGWDADVYERSTVELVGRGAGITTHPELLEALERSGAGTRDLGVEVEKRIALDRDGRVIGEKHLPQILTSWDRLQRLLRDTVDEARYHLGHAFERVEQDGSGVVVHFAGGRSERADILVGGDGIRSSVRAQMAPETRPIYAGYYIWRAAPNEADLKPETRASIFPYFIFFVAAQQHVFGYPIAGRNNDLRVGHRRYNVGWYRVADAQEMREMCVDENGHQHEYSVPPPLIRKDLIARMREDAEKSLPPQVLDCLTSTRPFFTRSTTLRPRNSHSAALRWSATPRPPRVRIWASAWQRPVATPRHWPRRLAATTISMRGLPPTIGSARALASESCCTGASSALSSA